MPITLTVIDGNTWIDDFQRKHPQMLLIDTLNDIGEAIASLGQRLAPVGETGALKSASIGMDNVSIRTPNVVQGTVGIKRIPRHGLWVHEGTGIFGPRRSPIVSPSGGLMTFRTREGRWISKRFIKGQHPQPYLRDAARVISHTYAPLRVRVLAERLAH